MKVLIPVEDRRYGEEQARFVVEHFWPQDVHFQVVHVLRPVYIGQHRYGYWAENFEQVLAKRLNEARQLVEEVSDRIRQGVKFGAIDELVMHGSPQETILKAAQEFKADLIVMGSHGRGAIPRFLLGSVSVAMITHAPCSVMIVRLPVVDEKETEAEKPAVVALEK